MQEIGDRHLGWCLKTTATTTKTNLPKWFWFKWLAVPFNILTSADGKVFEFWQAQIPENIKQSVILPSLWSSFPVSYQRVSTILVSILTNMPRDIWKSWVILFLSKHL